MANQTAQKVQFTFNNQRYEVYWNGKEYRQGMCYLTVSKVGGTSQYKGSYSKERESFVDFRAGELDLIKAAAKALEITE